MRDRIIVTDKDYLKKLIKSEMEINGNECDLNHLDVSSIINMGKLFFQSPFNGNISEWDVSNVKNMGSTFDGSKFNGDISKWDVSKVENMASMFYNSKFNGDISKWDVSSVEYMDHMFSRAKFDRDVSNWKPSKLDWLSWMFHECEAPVPYWARYDNLEDRLIAINNFELKKQLTTDLSFSGKHGKSPKI